MSGTAQDGTAPERDRDEEGRARSARPRDGLGRPLPYGASGVERQPEGVVRRPEETVVEAQALLDAGKPFHAHEVFEDAWKSGPDEERPLWRGLAQLAVGLTHSARGNVKGGARLLRRGAGAVEAWGAESGRWRPYGIELALVGAWARDLAGVVEREGQAVDAGSSAPRLRGNGAGNGEGNENGEGDGSGAGDGDGDGHTTARPGQR
ncbi:DUF309 domain-containing protein [Streptomyces sp. DSM 3412]|uniref:DUF309 domain-containing protein n=1 Tax=Streptomyces gottesmaniae TaxID=3075518 RepID=A0ABU2YZC9_9ACTN|nr:DUF309 domain-containing protein [Streptomyces sp. DSM 3412]MDT0569430.1 DUF309 domain-containing protein [Streptomyces sp. DSM 3412]